MKKIFLYSLFLILYSIFFIPSIYATEWNVCAEDVAGTSCSHKGIAGIQEAVEEAKNGDVININSGKYKSENPLVVDPEYRDQNCLIHTRGKNLTLKGVGNPMIDNNNGNLNNREKWSTGICILGGEVTIDSLTIRQTLLPAIYTDNAKVIIKNVTFIDIDHLAISIHRSQVYVINNLIAGSPGVSVGDFSYLRFENNTVYGGAIDFNLCENNQPTGDVLNNILIRSGITIKCSDQTDKLKEIKIKNNFVYHGSSTGDMNCAAPGNTENDHCTDKEICEGVTFVWPDIVGADENGTICVWGEGFIQGDFSTKPNSVAGLVNAGYSKGPCINGSSAACEAYIKTHPLPEPVDLEPLEPPGPGPGPGPGPNPRPNPNQTLWQIINPGNLPEIFGNLIALPNNIMLIQEKTTKDTSTGVFNLFMYVVFSLVYILVMHFAINMGSEFSLGFMVMFFVLGGIIGGWLKTYESGFVVAAILSLVFISGPKKEM